MPHTYSNKLSQVLDDAIHSIDGDYVSFKSLIDSLGLRSYGILFLLLILPHAIPIAGIIGISAISALFILIFSTQMAVEMNHPWLPKFIAKKELKKTILLRSLKIVKPFLIKIEPYIKPRWLIISHPLVLQFVGWVIAALCLVMLLPIPFSIVGPALAIFLISIGILEKDGLVIVLGICLGVIYSYLLFWLMAEAIIKVFNIFS